jgi:hypothetical protein
MNPLLQLLIAIALIAAMIVLKIVIGRRVMQQRLSCDPGNDACKETDCFHACDDLARPASAPGKAASPSTELK